MKCRTCARRLDLEKLDYTVGCKHEQMEGFICLACAFEGVAYWMTNVSDEDSYCEEYVEKQVTGKLINVEIPTKRESEETEKQVKGDSISREDAMMEARPEYLNPIQKGHEEYNKGWNDGVEAYWNGLKELPSEPVGISDNIEEMLQRFAQIMRNLEDMKILLSQRTGHWIEDEEQNNVEVCYHCSECGFEACGEHEKTRFCGGCGAWMREERKDDD